MKKVEYLLFSLILVFSFYFTDQIMKYIDSKNPLMEQIVLNQDNYNIKAVNAIIDGNTIIPGIKGREVDLHKSLVKMEEYGSFNDNYLIYNLITPDVSLTNNKEKIIIKGNSLKRAVSLVLEENKELEDFLNDNNIKYDILANINTDLSIKREYINGQEDKDKFSDLNTILNKKSLNNKICFLNYSNLNYCQKLGYIIITNSLNSKNKYEIIGKINSGDIVLINHNTSLEVLKLIISEIKKLDLKIVYLSDLIAE